MKLLSKPMTKSTRDEGSSQEQAKTQLHTPTVKKLTSNKRRLHKKVSILSFESHANFKPNDLFRPKRVVLPVH